MSDFKDEDSSFLLLVVPLGLKYSIWDFVWRHLWSIYLVKKHYVFPNLVWELPQQTFFLYNKNKFPGLSRLINWMLDSHGVLIMLSLMCFSYFYATGTGILQALFHIKLSNQFSLLHFWGEVFLKSLEFLGAWKILHPASMILFC